MTAGAMRVVLYARVSTAEQSVENQLAELRSHCASRGWTIVAEYSDQGFSGAKSSRPALDEMMEAAMRGLRDFDAILVWRLDRFGRNLRHLVNSVEQLQEAGVALVSLRDGFDLTTSSGKAMVGMVAVMAQFERDLIVERTKTGLRKAVASGKKLGRPRSSSACSRSTRWRRARQL